MLHGPSRGRVPTSGRDGEASRVSLDAHVPEVVAHLVGAAARTARRMDDGHSNAVFDVTLLDGREVILRLNRDADVMRATSSHIATLRELGLPVPSVMAEDRSRARFGAVDDQMSSVDKRQVTGDAIVGVPDCGIALRPAPNLDEHRRARMPFRPAWGARMDDDLVRAQIVRHLFRPQGHSTTPASKVLLIFCGSQAR